MVGAHKSIPAAKLGSFGTVSWEREELQGDGTARSVLVERQDPPMRGDH